MWVANAAGQLEVLDLETGKMAGALKGSAGSVRALALHPSEPVLASVGLDRFLRVHSTASRKQLAAVYLKQHLTGVAFCRAPDLPPTEAPAQEEGAPGEAQVHERAAGQGLKRAKSRKKSKQ